MEFLLLAKIGVAVDMVVKAGYAIAGGYFVRTAIRYVTDYKESITEEGGN